MEKVVLKRMFLNRRWVWPGFTRWGFDPDRLTEYGKKTIEDTVKGFGLDLKIGKHYMESVEKPFGIEFIAEKPHTVIENVIDTSKPWESRVSYASVVFDKEENKYKMWYSVLLYADNVKLTLKDGSAFDKKYFTLYAESDDGFNWVKPKLDFVFAEGESTNILTSVSLDAGAVFIDSNAKDKYKYKAPVAIVNWVPEIPEEKRFRLEIVGSVDGINWEPIGSDPLYRFFDTQNIVNYDKALGKYVGYFRHHNAGRSISRAEADDIKKLPMPMCIMSPTVSDPKDTDYYTNGFTVHPYDPEMRLFFSAMFHHTSDSVDVRLGVSADGTFFEWVSQEPIIDNYDNDGKYYATNYAYPELLPLGENVGLLLSRHARGHDEDWFERTYGEVAPSRYDMALWNADRIVGVKAETAGEFHSDLKLKSGKLQINFRTLSAKGFVKVEILDNFLPVENFTLEDSDSMSGDCNWADCSWNGNSDLSSLPSMNCKLRIHLENAVVYGIRVVAEEDTEINTQKTYNAL